MKSTVLFGEWGEGEKLVINPTGNSKDTFLGGLGWKGEAHRRLEVSGTQHPHSHINAKVSPWPWDPGVWLQGTEGQGSRPA